MAIPENERALSTEEMLAEEANEILGKPTIKLAKRLEGDRGKQAQRERALLNADERGGAEIDRDTVKARHDLYCALNELKRAALCFSGGGIRSATFCLGIVQALAACDTTPLEARQEPQPDDKSATTPERSLLGCFHYLSTVSGGGYVGSWLSSWRHRDTFANIFDNLTNRPNGPDIEAPEISWLRAYSNYLTPRIGLGSADTWAAVAIIVRNLVLNWLIIIPVLCAVLLALKIIVTGAVWVVHGNDNGRLVLGILLAGVICLIGAQAFTTYHRPPRRPPPSQSQEDSAKQPGNMPQSHFLWGDLIWSVLSAIAVTIFFSSQYFSKFSSQPRAADWPGFGFVKHVSDSGKVQLIAATAAAGFAIYALGWLCGFVPRRRVRDLVDWTWRLPQRLRSRQFLAGLGDFAAWAFSGLIYGALVGLGAVLFTMLGPYSASDDNPLRLLLTIIFGVPWVLTAQLTADNVFGGLVSYEPLSDSDREWLGRAAGWVAAVAIAWAILTALIFAGEYLVQAANTWISHAAAAAGGAIGIISGIITAILGKSSKSPAQSSSDDQKNFAAKASNIALAVAGPLFVAVLIVALSVGLDELLLPRSLIVALQPVKNPPPLSFVNWLAIGLAITVAIAVAASYFVNINRFSLHALYRNRLTRAYLGASRQARHPDQFTGFDLHDNVRMHDLWPPKSEESSPKPEERRLFHVVNIALNVVATKRWAWQERKAEPFTASPRHCGSAYLGFRRSKYYGDGPKNAEAESDPTRRFGIALGTAMAISGAAVSSNMGYHSSSSLALLLTLFNVRLGWWLGNPGPAGDHWHAYRREGPTISALPLLFEAFGQTTDRRPYVYLSDGGHFENLGLYEMVRRRCRLIVLVDAGCDPKFALEDLGNAVRKIYIDLGIRITFKGLQKLKNRPSKRDAVPAEEIPYHAIGTIEYDDPAADGPGCENGTVIYIKPAYHGDEGAAIRAYAKASKTFPHESTADQWFTESQFESYRALGLDIAKKVLKHGDVHRVLHDFLKQPAHHKHHA